MAQDLTHEKQRLEVESGQRAHELDKDNLDLRLARLKAEMKMEFIKDFVPQAAREKLIDAEPLIDNKVALENGNMIYIYIMLEFCFWCGCEGQLSCQPGKTGL